MPAPLASANDRLPRGPWLRTWIFSVVAALTVVGAQEEFWRSRGFVPSVADDAELWSYARGQVQAHDPEQVVLIGSSRIRLGIDCDAWAEAFNGRRPVQLAVNGSSCLPVLEELSRDPGFQGLVLCDATLRIWFREGKPFGGTQAEYVRRYENRTAFAGFEQRLRILTQGSLACRLPDVAMSRVAARLMAHEDLPKPSHLVTFPDRSIHADFRRFDVPEAMKGRGNAERILRSKYGISPDGFRSYVAEIRNIVRSIQKRGGEVVFLALPVSGTVRTLEEEFYPRAQYWDVLATQTGALAIHFSDYPALAGFQCPEGSHLDERDAAVYSRELAKIVKSRLRRGGTDRHAPQQNQSG